MHRHERLIGKCIGLALLWGSVQSARAEDVPGLHEGRTIVTGQGEDNRAIGVIACFRDVLVKVSGDAGLLGRAVPDGEAAAAVTRYDYHDRMAGLPLHDEEGTRRRPYDLTVDFDPAKVSQSLHAMGSVAWLGPRPRVVPFVAVTRDDRSFLLASDGEASYGQRDALRDAAWQAGLPVVLPDTATLARDGLSAERGALDGPSRAVDLAKADGGDVALVGTLSWSDEAIRWTGRWHMSFEGRQYDWDNSAESFDASYRGAMRGAALVLSGHAPPGNFTVP